MTQFEVKPIEEKLKNKKVAWEDGDRKILKILTRGQRRKLAVKVEEHENEGQAMWSTLRRQRAPFPKGQKALSGVSVTRVRVLPTTGHQDWMFGEGGGPLLALHGLPLRTMVTLAEDAS